MNFASTLKKKKQNNLNSGKKAVEIKQIYYLSEEKENYCTLNTFSNHWLLHLIAYQKSSLNNLIKLLFSLKEIQIISNKASLVGTD